MARDHARVNLAIWNDDDFLDLPPLAQHLYFVLWTHPKLSYAGVVDWRPARLAAVAQGWTEDDLRKAGDCLAARYFIVIDEDKEECLIRSYVRFDGLMKQPIMAVSFTKARAAVSSRVIKAVIVFEAQKLHAREPGLSGWARPQVQELLKQRSVDARTLDTPADPYPKEDLTPPLTPDLRVRNSKPNPCPNPSPNPSPTPTPTPTPYLPPLPDEGTTTEAANADDEKPGKRRKPERPLPDSWKPNVRHHEIAAEKRVDLEAAVTAFRNHAETHDRRARDWDAAFRTWLNKSAAFAPPTNAGMSIWEKKVNRD